MKTTVPPPAEHPPDNTNLIILDLIERHIADTQAVVRLLESVFNVWNHKSAKDAIQEMGTVDDMAEGLSVIARQLGNDLLVIDLNLSDLAKRIGLRCEPASGGAR